MRHLEIVGYCNQTDVPSLELAVRNGTPKDRHYPLSCQAGLPSWVREQFHAVGAHEEAELRTAAEVLTEVADAVRSLCELAPTLSLSVHVAAGSGTRRCIATVVGVGRPQGQAPRVEVTDPGVERLSEEVIR